jgi:hypothetical protein
MDPSTTPVLTQQGHIQLKLICDGQNGATRQLIKAPCHQAYCSHLVAWKALCSCQMKLLIISKLMALQQDGSAQ